MTAAVYIVSTYRWDKELNKSVKRDVRVRATLTVKEGELLARMVTKAARSKSGKATAQGGCIVVSVEELGG